MVDSVTNMSGTKNVAPRFVTTIKLTFTKAKYVLVNIVLDNKSGRDASVHKPVVRN